jgi:uroporphyrinogen-III synthase
VIGGAGCAAYCVGDRTAQAAQGRGWNVALVAETADDLVGQMVGVRGPLLHLAGQHRRGEIADRLTSLGVTTDVMVVYDQPEQRLSVQARDLLSSGDLIVAPLFSPRSAQLFVGQVQEFGNMHIIAMSGAVVAALGTIVPKQMHIARAPTGEEMRRCVEKLLVGDTLP